MYQNRTIHNVIYSLTSHHNKQDIVGFNTRNIKMMKAMSTLHISKRYEDAVETLNTLQGKPRYKRELKIPNMIQYANRAGISLDDIDSLNVIHVSGTKGKGSTCAFTESILRHHGYKTGFLSSPHLVEVRERLRINGTSLTREKFADCFWEVYDKLKQTKTLHDDSMPGYFGFCTIMAFHVFLQEKIDVAIIEVGIGGEYDSTNLIRKPVVCGVSSLGIDHISVLGNSIDQIAWHKAGIFKTGVPAFAVPQVPEALQVLKERAAEKGIIFHQVPSLETFEQGRKLSLGLEGAIQRTNASLALQLCKTWLDRQQDVNNVKDCKSVTGSNGITETNGYTLHTDTCDSFPLSDQMISGLENCRWAGRNQTIHKEGLTYFLDGAHTIESMQQCVDWFNAASTQESKSITGKVTKMIIFNTTRDRDQVSLISPLTKCSFDAVMFCPNLAFSQTNTADQTNNTVTTESQHKRCVLNLEAWKQLHSTKTMNESDKKEKSAQTFDISAESSRDSYDKASHSKHIASSNDHSANDQEEVTNGKHTNGKCQSKGDNNTKHSSDQEEVTIGNHANGECQSKGDNNTEHCSDQDCDDLFIKVYPCIYDALCVAAQGRDPLVQDCLQDLPQRLRDSDHIQVLVTGSLHLVGGVLGVVGPDYN